MELHPQLMEILGGWIANRPKDRPALIGVAGSQGSGKTTLCRAAAQKFGAAHFSIDDVYLQKAAREKLAEEVHPLFSVRGPPGTHDLDLAKATIEALARAHEGSRTPIPAFDKLADERLPAEKWPVFEGHPAAVLVDGWCVGATPIDDEELAQPANELEEEEDTSGAWRRYWNAQLRESYARWFETFDAVLFLRAPSFDVVLDWRCEQEAELMGLKSADLPLERRAHLARFIVYYERLTRHMLAGGIRADATAQLNKNRAVQSVRKSSG